MRNRISSGKFHLAIYIMIVLSILTGFFKGSTTVVALEIEESDVVKTEENTIGSDLSVGNLVDTSVAKVNDKGRITACSTGNTAILVSNGDMTISVGVIVGTENTGTENVSDTEIADEDMQSQSFDAILLASEYPVITEEMLTYYYQNQSVVCIQGDGYSIQLDGKDILNVQNSLSTDIELISGKKGIIFTLNNSDYLPGPVTICIENSAGKYLYLYNIAKNRYEQIATNNMKAVKLTTAGKYLITKRKLQGTDGVIVVVMISGTLIVLSGVVAYILVKKKYWFW